MTTKRVLVVAAALGVLLACKSDKKNKNDDIAACNATGGRWTEGGCNDNGHCEKTSGMAPDDDFDDDAEEEDDAGP